MDAKKIIELRKQAEKAVADMQDGEFKLKAFEVILNHFLSPGKPESTSESSTAPKAGTKRQRSIDKEAESTAGRILVLKDEGFMSSPKSISQIRAELQAHGWHYPVTALSGELMKIVQKRNLRRQKGKVGKRTVWLYTNP
jgi:hypothetical protein